MENTYLNKKPVVISIVATRSNTGKTTLIEKLIAIFKDRNYSVGVLKHDAHKFDIDKEGKDTYRFSKAGADNVIIASSKKMAMIKVLKEEKSIEDILPFFNDLDIVIIEGFKNNNYPKIEVHRNGVDQNLLCKNPNFKMNTFIAIASDEHVNVDIPILDLNNAEEVADFLEKSLITRR